MDKKKTILLFIRIMLLLIIIVCLTRIGQTYYLSVRHRQQQEKLSTAINTTKLQSMQPQESNLQKHRKRAVTM